MSASGTLELTLRDILCVINPSEEDWSKRFQIINELRAVVQSMESFRGATVEPFGSFVSNLFTRWGDLDISIELANGSYISAAGKKHKQTLLEDLHKVLRRRGGWRRLLFIAHARVPILKFESSYLDISCDISINNLNGQMKSKLLFWIDEIDKRFRDMVLLVKEWAKAHGINDSKAGTLNSYSLSLLVIFHFQTCTPPLLPPLKDIYPGNLVDDLTGVRAVAEEKIEETCAKNINKFRSNKSRVRNPSTLSQLFISFLEKFSDLSSRASEEGICPYTGQWEHIDSNMRWMPRTYALFVEDPFEQPINTARSVNRGQLMRISEAFRTTHQILSSGNQNRNSLIQTLVGPRASQFLLRMPLNNPSGFNGSNGRIHPQAHRAVHAPSQVQHQFQNTRVGRRPNNLTARRTVGASQVQGPQVWRPRSER
ncbi:Polynucleotide adenylyltransferase [Bertholletia excelsa]